MHYVKKVRRIFFAYIINIKPEEVVTFQTHQTPEIETENQ